MGVARDPHCRCIYDNVNKGYIITVIRIMHSNLSLCEQACTNEYLVLEFQSDQWYWGTSLNNNNSLNIIFEADESVTSII